MNSINLNSDHIIKMFANFEIMVSKSWEDETNKQNKSSNKQKEDELPNNNPYYR